MPMVMAIPAMPMVMMVPHLNHYLRIRCRHQRQEEREGKNSKCQFLHVHDTTHFLVASSVLRNGDDAIPRRKIVQLKDA